MNDNEALRSIVNHTWGERHQDAVLDSAMRVLGVGAKAPLQYKGMGQFGVVFCDARGIGYKAARNPADNRNRQSIEEEAEWLRVASSVPEMKAHIAQYRHFWWKQCVIERQCISGTSGARRGKDTRFDLHRQLADIIGPYGFGMPEFKDDSYVWQSGRGWVLVDASSPILKGRRLVAQAVQTLNGDRFHGERPADTAWALSMESGKTVDESRAKRLYDRLSGLSDVEERPSKTTRRFR